MQTVDDVEFGQAFRRHRLGQPHGLFDPHRVRIGLAGLALERAIGAGRTTHVRHVEVAVDVEVGRVAVLLGADVVSQAAQPRQLVTRVEGYPVVEGQPLAAHHFGFEFTLQTSIHGLSVGGATMARRATPIGNVSHLTRAGCMKDAAAGHA